MATVGLKRVGDGHEDHDEAGGKGEVAPPVDAGRTAKTSVLELEVSPEGSQHPEGHIYPEH